MRQPLVGFLIGLVLIWGAVITETRASDGAVEGVLASWPPEARRALLEDAIIDALSCTKNPRPTHILTYLGRNGFIDFNENIGYDSVSCFSFKEKFSLKGSYFNYVCGYAEDYFLHFTYPEIYYRGPGTSPGGLFLLGRQQDTGTLELWWREQVGTNSKSRTRFRQGDDSFLFNEFSGAVAEIQCSQFDFGFE